MRDFKASDKIDVSVSQSMKSYPKLCHRLLILSNCWASEKSTSRFRNGWKPVQNMGDWIVRCTRNHKKSEPHFEVPEMLELWKKRSKPQEKGVFYFRMFRGPGNASAPFLCCQSKGFTCVFLFFGASTWGSDLCVTKFGFLNSDLHLRIGISHTQKRARFWKWRLENDDVLETLSNLRD